MAIRTVLWDMDGTLLDSEKVYFVCCADYAHDMGYLFIQPDFFTRYRGVSPQETGRRMEKDFAALGVQLSPDELDRQRILRYLGYIRRCGVPVFPGAYAALGKLGAMGIKQAVCTSSARGDASQSLALSGILPKLQTVVYGDEIARPKPEPDAYLTAAAHLQVKPQDCLVVEDSRVGLESALRAGMHAAFRDDGEPLPDGVLRFGHLSQIPEFVKNL